MFIKVKNQYDCTRYLDTNNKKFDISIYKNYYCDFYCFTLFDNWASDLQLGKKGEFKKVEEVEKIAETIISSIVKGVQILDLNNVIDKIEKES